MQWYIDWFIDLYAAQICIWKIDKNIKLPPWMPTTPTGWYLFYFLSDIPNPICLIFYRGVILYTHNFATEALNDCKRVWSLLADFRLNRKNLWVLGRLCNCNVRDDSSQGRFIEQWMLHKALTTALRQVLGCHGYRMRACSPKCSPFSILRICFWRPFTFLVTRTWRQSTYERKD